MLKNRLLVWSLMLVAASWVTSCGATARAAEESKAAAAATVGHGGDHAHAFSDPTHGDASEQLYNPVDWREDMAIFTAIVFLLLLGGLYLAAWKPIMEGLEKREHAIAGNIKAAEQAAADAQSKLREYESKLSAAADEAARIVAEARKDAEAAGARIVASAEEEATRQRDRAVADIDAAKRVALSELASKSTDVAMSLAQRIVGREVKAADHQGLIQDMLAQLPSKN